jgi:hypothetical protein
LIYFIGDQVFVNNDDVVTVQKSEVISESTEVYNFQVKANENYFITTSKILVHNNSYLPLVKRISKLRRIHRKD